MPDTRITKERLKNHWMYSSWKYLLMALIFIMGWNIVYNVTAYKPPREKRLELYLLSGMYNEDGINKLEGEIRDIFVGDEADDMEEVNFITMNVGGENDVYAPQLLMTRLASLEGDVYLVDEHTVTSLVMQELALPLDEYIASGALNVAGQDLSTGMRAEPIGEDDDGNVIYGAQHHVYAIPAEPLYGLLEENIINNRGMYFVVMSYTDKADKCIEMLNVFIDRFKTAKPQWLTERDERQRQEIAELPSELTVESLSAQATPAPSPEADATAPEANKPAGS